MDKSSTWRPARWNITKIKGTKGMLSYLSFTCFDGLVRRFHCETRILTMLFGLLYSGILFLRKFWAHFETPYQTAPLDLFYDTFYRARKDMIDERLQEIREMAKLAKFWRSTTKPIATMP
jgi:hypothetical protein